MEEILLEGSQIARYSVEVNYRTEIGEVLNGFAKIALGYISAAMKKYGYHCKMVFTQKPFRAIISSRNWDDGEWVAVVCFNHENNHFEVGEGYFNKDRKSVSISKKEKTDDKSASDVVKKIKDLMETLKRKDKVDNTVLNPPHLKRGPKSIAPKKKSISKKAVF